MDDGGLGSGEQPLSDAAESAILTQSFGSRVFKGVAANGFGQFVTLLSNLVMVPLFFRFWGAELFGEWQMLAGVPLFLTMSDLSFGTTAGSEMTMLEARGDRLGALKVLQSAWLLVTIVSFGILAVMLVAIHLVPVSSSLHLSIFSNREAIAVLTILLLSVCISQQGGLLDAVFKCSGRYASGIFILNLFRLVETVAGIGVLVFHGDPWLFAWTLLVPKAVAYILIWWYLGREVPWLYLGWEHASLKTLKPLVTPALTFNAFNLGYAMSIQGAMLIVGVKSSPLQVAVWSPMRTISRTVLQGSNALSNTIWVELSRAMGAGDLERARRLHRRMGQLSLWFTVPSLVILALVGPWLFRVWTGVTSFDYPLYIALLVVALLGTVWSSSYVVSLSINRHQSTAITFIVTASATLGLASVLANSMGALGVALALILGELAMVVFVIRLSLRLLQDSPGAYLVQLAQPPTDLLGRIVKRLRRDKRSRRPGQR